jgi:hypothetical protein
VCVQELVKDLFTAAGNGLSKKPAEVRSTLGDRLRIKDELVRGDLLMGDKGE